GRASTQALGRLRRSPATPSCRRREHTRHCGRLTLPEALKRPLTRRWAPPPPRQHGPPHASALVTSSTSRRSTELLLTVPLQDRPRLFERNPLSLIVPPTR